MNKSESVLWVTNLGTNQFQVQVVGIGEPSGSFLIRRREFNITKNFAIRTPRLTAKQNKEYLVARVRTVPLTMGQSVSGIIAVFGRYSTIMLETSVT